MNEKIKTLLVGVGQLGEHHARILKGMQNVELIGVVDSDQSRGQKISKKHDVEYYGSIDNLPVTPKAVVIVTPTPTHYSIAKKFIDNGVSCFVEKPFTQTVEEAQDLIEIAEHRDIVLQVGHIERFNPAIEATKPFISNPRFIETHRLGPFSSRVGHIGVIMDLMIHDIDILLYLVGSKIDEIEAFGAKVFTDHEDIARVRIKFKTGCIADLTASRVSFEKQRKIRVFQSESYISVDYASKTVRVFRKKNSNPKDLSDISIETPKVRAYDQLEHELAHFIECVMHGKEPLVTGEHGRDALEVVHEILKIIKF